MFLLLLLLYTAHVTRGFEAQVYAQMLVKTRQPCSTTAQCVGDLAFCNNGSVCLRGHCWRLPDFPCARSQWCDERLRQCRTRTCASWRDCDDGVYCNGEERCIAGQCVLDPASDCSCSGDLCDEAAQRCTRVQTVQRARERLSGRGVQVALVPASGEGHFSIRDTNTSNTTTPVGSISNEELAWILVALCGLVVVFVFFWIIYATSRRRAPAILIDHRSAANGGSQVYTEELNY